MNDKRMKKALENIARRGVPENTNLMPRIAAQLERKSPMTTLRTRPFAVVLIALFILLTLSGVAYALGKALGYIPGVGIVDQSSPLRVLAEPVSQTRDGITVTVSDAVLSADRTIVVVKFENVPVDKVPNQEDNPDCYPAPAFQLPVGDPLQPLSSQGNDWGAGSEYHYTYAAVPADVNDITLFIGCVPGDVSPRVLPENWELPLHFVPAPPDMTALPVIEYVPSPVPTNVSGEDQIAITKVIDLGDSYILVGKFPLLTNSLGYFTPGMRMLLDGNGNILPWKMPQDSVLPPPDPNAQVTTEDWAVQVDKGFVSPLTIKITRSSSYPTANDAPLEYEFDAGENPKIGDEWQVNQKFDAGGHPFTLLSIRAEADTDNPGLYGYRFNFKPLDNDITNLYIDINGVQFMSYTLGGTSDGVYYFVSYPELPKGKLKVSFSLEINDPQEWTLQWTPDASSSNIVTPTEAPQACLTDDSWQAALSNPAPIPSNLTGKLIAYGRTVEDGKDPNPDNTGMFTINLDGSNKQILGQGMSPALSPDGTRAVYFGSDGLYLVDLASSATSHIPNTVVDDYFPRWSPDGKQIAFFHSLDSDLYIINPDGSGLRRAFQGIDAEQLVGWTSDSRGLYYFVNTQTGAELRLVDIESQNVTSLFENDGYTFLDVSPDGSKIAFVSHPNNLYISNVDGTDRELLGFMGNLFVSPPIVWSPDGKWLIVNIRKLSDPDIAGFPIPHALVSVTDCQIIPIPWSGEVYSWVP
jgi:hypothetical protein